MSAANVVTPGEAFLYLIEFPGHGVKVGISTRPESRLSQHRRDASAYGRICGRTWVSPVPHGNARDNERSIKGSSKREYLTRSFEECLREAEALPMLRLDPATVQARTDATFSFFKSIVEGVVA